MKDMGSDVRFDGEQNEGGLSASVEVGRVQGGGGKGEVREKVERGARGTNFGRGVVRG